MRPATGRVRVYGTLALVVGCGWGCGAMDQGGEVHPDAGAAGAPAHGGAGGHGSGGSAGTQGATGGVAGTTGASGSAGKPGSGGASGQAGTGGAAGKPGTGGAAGKPGTGGASTAGSGTAGASGAGGAAGACELATKPGQSVVVACATQVTLHDAGDGFRPSAPAGSKCAGERSYSLAIESGDLSWSVCEVGNGTSPWMLNQGMRKLSDAELQSALMGLRSVTIQSGNAGCGADKPTLTIEVALPSAKATYTDSFYMCRTTPGAIYVDNIDDAFSALSKLATP